MRTGSPSRPTTSCRIAAGSSGNRTTPCCSAAIAAWNAGFSRHPLGASPAERDTPTQPHSPNASERQVPELRAMDAGWRRLPSLVLMGSPQSYRSAPETSRHRPPRGGRNRIPLPTPTAEAKGTGCLQRGIRCARAADRTAQAPPLPWRGGGNHGGGLPWGCDNPLPTPSGNGVEGMASWKEYYVGRGGYFRREDAEE